MKFVVLALMLALSLAGCKRGCPPGVQEGHSNPPGGGRPSICEGKRD